MTLKASRILSAENWEKLSAHDKTVLLAGKPSLLLEFSMLHWYIGKFVHAPPADKTKSSEI